MPLTSDLNTLESSGLIRLVATQPDVEYFFRHALMQEAAYASLLKQDRKRLHRAVGEALEQACSGQADELAPLLGQHFYEAGDDARALKYLVMAADAAARRYANREAVKHYTDALEVAQRNGAVEPRLYRARGLARETLGEFDNARADYEAALQAAQATGDRRAEWEALLDLGLLWAGRDYARTGEYYRRAVALAGALDDRAILAHSMNRLGNWHLNIEEPLDALRYHREALAIFQELNDRRGIAATSDFLGLASYLSGDLAQGTAYFDRAIALFRELDDRQGLASSLTSMTLRGLTPQTNVFVPSAATLSEAAQDGETALQIVREIGWRSGEAFTLFALAFCFGGSGNYARALDCAWGSLAIAEEIGHHQWMAGACCALGAIYNDLLALTEARRHLERGLVLAGEIGSWNWTHMVTGVLASTCVLQGDLAYAEAVLDAALGPDAPAQTVGQRISWCARVELALARGDAEAALQITDKLIASAANVEPDGKRPILRVSQLRGRTLTALRRFAEAEVALRAAREIAITHGARPMAWRIHVDLGKVYQAQARHEEAERELATARTTIQELAANVPAGALRDNFLQRALTSAI
ncbi:MAG: hypothetical protein IT330_18755 [Anaerolineae bacterium]|nr:hypothetical protein [Anaerolineae bacterium]